MTDDKHSAANDDSGEGENPVEVPHTALAGDLLRAVIESFVLREGTDYGERELSLDDKVRRVVGSSSAAMRTSSSIPAPRVSTS